MPISDYGRSDGRWRQIDWRKHLRRIDLTGARSVNFVDYGEGPPVLFVHGLGGSWQAWLENIPDFARHNRVVALDLPGFGDSPMPEWQISMPAYGRMLAEFCERLELGPETAVVGHSMGGFIATEMVIDHPERFGGLVLVSAAGITFARARNEPARVMGRIARLARPVVTAYGNDAVTRPRLRQIVFRGVVHRPERLEPEILWELTQGGLGPPAFNDALVELWGYDARERLPEIGIPTLVVWGYNDRVVPVRAALSYRRRIPDSTLEIFDRTGHLPMLERPERFNGLVADFLEGLARGESTAAGAIGAGEEASTAGGGGKARRGEAAKTG